MSTATLAIRQEVHRLTGEHAITEYKFHPERKWRFDLAWERQKVAVEIHGSVWQQGRHTRGKGFSNDREKMNAAIALGWVTLEYPTDRIQREFGAVCEEIACLIKARDKSQ